MIALQEELDWRCYTLYGITDQNLCYRDASDNQLDPPAIALGQRAFEIVMARKMAAGELETTWFERHRSTPITELPGHWPDDYRRLVERRMALIESNHVHQPHRAPRIQAPLEHRTLGRAGKARPQELAARPPGGRALLAGAAAPDHPHAGG